MGRVIGLLLTFAFVAVAGRLQVSVPPHPGDGPLPRVASPTMTERTGDAFAALEERANRHVGGRRGGPGQASQGSAERRVVDFELILLDPTTGAPVRDASVVVGLADRDRTDWLAREGSSRKLAAAGGSYRSRLDVVDASELLVEIKHGAAADLVWTRFPVSTNAETIRVVTELGEIPSDSLLPPVGTRGTLVDLDDVSNGLDDTVRPTTSALVLGGKRREPATRVVEIRTIDDEGRLIPHARIAMFWNDQRELRSRRLTAPGVNEPIPRTDARGGGFFSPVPESGDVAVIALLGKRRGRATIDASTSAVTIVLRE